MRDDDGEGLGARFWITLLALLMGAAIAAGLLLFLVGWAWAAVGFLGTLVLFGAIALGAAAIVDRRERRKRLAT